MQLNFRLLSKHQPLDGSVTLPLKAGADAKKGADINKYVG